MDHQRDKNCEIPLRIVYDFERESIEIAAGATSGTTVWNWNLIWTELKARK